MAKRRGIFHVFRSEPRKALGTLIADPLRLPFKRGFRKLLPKRFLILELLQGKK